MRVSKGYNEMIRPPYSLTSKAEWKAFDRARQVSHSKIFCGIPPQQIDGLKIGKAFIAIASFLNPLLQTRLDQTCRNTFSFPICELTNYLLIRETTSLLLSHMIKTFMTRLSHIHTKSCWTLIKSFASESFDTSFKSVQPLQWGDFSLSDQPHLQPFCQWPPILQTIYFSRSQNFYQFFPTFPLFSFPVNSYIAFFLLLWHPCTIHHPMLAPVLISLLLPICSFESPEKICLLGKECKTGKPSSPPRFGLFPKWQKYQNVCWSFRRGFSIF